MLARAVKVVARAGDFGAGGPGYHPCGGPYTQ